jgi:hypothetical protein
MNLQLINPDRAPHGVRAMHSIQSVCGPPMAHTTHCDANFLPFGKSSQLAGSEPVKVTADAPSLSNWNSPVTHLIHINKVTKALFRCKKFGKMDIVAFSLLFDN